MKAITVRGVDPELEEKLRTVAKQEGKSVNQLVIETLRRCHGLEKDRKYTRKYRDLDHLFGSWSQKEFESIQAKVDSERIIDAELWE